MKNVSILGTKYTVNEGTRAEIGLDPIVAGDCCSFDKTINVATDTRYAKDTMRHEIIHAFIFESGFAFVLGDKEECVTEWLTIQLPKMIDAMNEVDAL